MKNLNMILLSALTLVMTSCGGNDSSVELEKEKLKLEREKLELEKSKTTNSETEPSGAKQEIDSKSEANAQTEKERRQEVADRASQANRFQPYTDAVVVVRRTYFYSSPSEDTKRTAFLIEGDRITVEKSQRNFVKVTFTNESNGRITSGWIKSDDLEPIYAD
jgi:hypothetical protein